LILVTTALLLVGQVLPPVLLVLAILSGDGIAAGLAGFATGAAYAPRLDAVRRFRQPWLGALLHPLGVLLVLAIQWYATARALIGRPVGWKGRAHPTAVSAR
jgi:hypothetical protein